MMDFAAASGAGKHGSLLPPFLFWYWSRCAGSSRMHNKKAYLHFGWEDEPGDPPLTLSNFGPNTFLLLYQGQLDDLPDQSPGNQFRDKRLADSTFEILMFAIESPINA